jgi:transposase-like protein
VAETNVFELTQPGTFSDPLTEVLRNGARTLLGLAVEAEVAAWLSTHTDKLTDDGRRRLVRYGHMPEREVMTGIGAVAVRCPRARDRVGEGGERIRFWSAILPPYARRSKSLEVLIPILYLKGISTEWCDRRLLARIHHYTVKRLRAEIEPVSARDFLRFLLAWQRLIPNTRMEGPDALVSIALPRSVRESDCSVSSC